MSGNPSALLVGLAGDVGNPREVNVPDGRGSVQQRRCCLWQRGGGGVCRRHPERKQRWGDTAKPHPAGAGGSGRRVEVGACPAMEQVCLWSLSHKQSMQSSTLFIIFT